MKKRITLKEIMDSFDVEFNVGDIQLQKDASVWKGDFSENIQKELKSFIESTIKEVLESVVPEERNSHEDDAEQSYSDSIIYESGWNDCCKELEKNIKKIID